MILDGFRKTCIRKKITKELLKSNSVNDNLNNKIDSVLILVDDNSKENLDEIVSKKLAIDVSKVITILFETNQEADPKFKKVLIENDFSLFGKLNNDTVRKLLKTEFDLLLNYTENNLFLNYITAFSKASFKVGVLNNQQQLFDLIIEVKKEEVNLFHSELIKYLKILNKI